MKKIIYLLLLILSLTFVVGCNKEDNPSNPPVSDEFTLDDVKFEDATIIYDGEPHSIVVTNLPKGYTVVYEGNAVVEVGTYTVIARIRDVSLNVVKELSATITIKLEEINPDIQEKPDVELPLV